MKLNCFFVSQLDIILLSVLLLVYCVVKFFIAHGIIYQPRLFPSTSSGTNIASRTRSLLKIENKFAGPRFSGIYAI